MKIFEIIIGLATALSLMWAYFSREKYPSAVARIVFVVIWTNAASFFLKLLLFALTKEGGERIVLIVSSALAPILVAAYWHRYWQQKRPDKKPRG